MVNIIVEIESFKSTSLQINRPKWIDVYKHYPKINAGSLNENDEPAVSIFKKNFGENYDRQVFTNACATRVSIALLGANIKVKGDFVIQKGEYKGKGIITSAIKLLEWLSSDSVFGKADIVINSPSSFNDVYSKLKEKKGIYILESNNYRWASGHATLWYNGNAIGKHNYWKHAKSIHFWELK